MGEDIREEIIEFCHHVKELADFSLEKVIRMIGIGKSRFYDWHKRRGVPNKHNGKIPRKHWILSEEVRAIIAYCKDKREEGYRRLCYMMIDENIAFVSPSTTYRVLKEHDLLNRWMVPGKTAKGDGFQQPDRIHRDWHTDIAYVNILGTFFFLITILDGFSRKVLHHELRANMKEYDVELTIQKAREKYPDANPIIISDNGPQYISKDFKIFIRESGLRHIRTSVNHPQSNGKLERFHKTIKTEKIRRSSFVNAKDAREQVNCYIKYYNEERLHSALYYLTPQEVFEGKMEKRLAERKEKLDTAREERCKMFQNRLSA